MRDIRVIVASEVYQREPLINICTFGGLWYREKVREDSRRLCEKTLVHAEERQIRRKNDTAILEPQVRVGCPLLRRETSSIELVCSETLERQAGDAAARRHGRSWSMGSRNLTS